MCYIVAVIKSQQTSVSWLCLLNTNCSFTVVSNNILDYYEEGFLTLQHALHQSVVEILNPNASMQTQAFSTKMERFPYPPYTNDIFLTVIQTNFPFFIMLCMIFFSLSIPKEVTLEKEKKLKVGS